METANPDRLSSLPLETLLEVFSYVSLDKGGFSLVRASRKLYHLLILELYKERGRESHWGPLFAGAVSGNILTLKRCLEAGASLNCRWLPYDPNWWVLAIYKGEQPLHVAMMHYQVEAVEWMLDQMVNPYEKNENGTRRTLELICESDLIKGHYPEWLQEAARWRKEPLRIPNRDVLALRGRKIAGLVLTAGALHNPRLTRALLWTPNGVEDTLVEAKGFICDDLLCRLPREILLKVLSNLSPSDGGCSLVMASKFFYHTLILDLYREAGRQLSWLPLFVGAIDGNLRTLQACLKAGAPIDHQWKGNHLTSEWNFTHGSRPLHVAIDYVQLRSVRWLIAKGAYPWRTQGDSRLSPQILAWKKSMIAHYPDSKQNLWWRQNDFMVPHCERMMQGCRHILEFLARTIWSRIPVPTLVEGC